MPPNEQKSPLVGYLTSLVEQDDRASLAALRSALRPGRELDALRFVVPFLPENNKDGTPLSPARRRQNEDDAVLLASLFALHQESGSSSLATAMRLLFRESESESIKGRFRALLSAERSELGTHLRHAVSLCAKYPLDWEDLYKTIRSWDDENQRARRAWARDFWNPFSSDASDELTSNTSA